MSKVSILLIKAYRIIMVPIISGMKNSGVPINGCIFTPTCSEFAIQAFRKYSFIVAFKRIINRIKRCKPGNLGGYDPP